MTDQTEPKQPLVLKRTKRHRVQTKYPSGKSMVRTVVVDENDQTVLFDETEYPPQKTSLLAKVTVAATAALVAYGILYFRHRQST